MVTLLVVKLSWASVLKEYKHKSSLTVKVKMTVKVYMKNAQGTYLQGMYVVYTWICDQVWLKGTSHFSNFESW